MWVKEEDKMIAESRKKSKTEGLKVLAFDCISCCCRQLYLPVLLEMYQDLGISAQMLLEGLPELS